MASETRLWDSCEDYAGLWLIARSIHRQLPLGAYEISWRGRCLQSVLLRLVKCLLDLISLRLHLSYIQNGWSYCNTERANAKIPLNRGRFFCKVHPNTITSVLSIDLLSGQSQDTSGRSLRSSSTARETFCFPAQKTTSSTSGSRITESGWARTTDTTARSGQSMSTVRRTSLLS